MDVLGPMSRGADAAAAHRGRVTCENETLGKESGRMIKAQFSFFFLFLVSDSK